MFLQQQHHTRAQVLSRRVWDILTLLPTNPTLLEGFQKLGTESDKTNDAQTKLETLLDPSSPQKLMYSLYIVEALTRPTYTKNLVSKNLQELLKNVYGIVFFSKFLQNFYFISSELDNLTPPFLQNFFRISVLTARKLLEFRSTFFDLGSLCIACKYTVFQNKRSRRKKFLKIVE